MTENLSTQVKKPRFRSPPYPMFDLAEAVERAKLIHTKAHHHSVGADVLLEAWKLKSVDGKLWRAAAALIQYGLLSDSGSGKSRKFQVTDIAKRIVLDEDRSSEKRVLALKTAALTPMINRELWEKFGTANELADSVILTHLTIDRGEAGEAVYSSSAAEEVLSRYRASLIFAGLDEDGQLPPKYGREEEAHITPLEVPESAVRDVTNGFSPNEVEIGTSQPGDSGDKPNQEFGADGQEDRKSDTKTKKISAHVEGGRLKITADVDSKEIKALQEMLTKYKEILDMLD